MTRAPTAAELRLLARELMEPRSLPARDPARTGIVTWRSFRTPQAAVDYAAHVLLEPGERLVGGSTRDSVGPLWWVGVAVDDPERWGNRAAIHKTDGVDPCNPRSPML